MKQIHCLNIFYFQHIISNLFLFLSIFFTIELLFQCQFYFVEFEFFELYKNAACKYFRKKGEEIDNEIVDVLITLFKF